jgi:hypothetical protein
MGLKDGLGQGLGQTGLGTGLRTGGWLKRVEKKEMGRLVSKIVKKRKQRGFQRRFLKVEVESGARGLKERKGWKRWVVLDRMGLKAREKFESKGKKR